MNLGSTHSAGHGGGYDDDREVQARALHNNRNSRRLLQTTRIRLNSQQRPEPDIDPLKRGRQSAPNQ